MKIRIGLFLLALLGLLTSPAIAAEQAQEWEVLNPTGVVKQANIKPAARPDTLEGKTIVFRWNGKHNGNNFLQRLTELMAEKYPSAKIVKAWEVDPSLNKISGNKVESKRIAKALKDMGADLVIASQCD
ncbi:hypothetical protein DND132_2344 [Pseudodesulfovibrio mercurii]|nr:hypothetical protein [Pseudodesulfovibrio mercurii]EGB15548.1 hypothetical protein DND132_2344 [Pseudodesulfovibrio mercurii]